MIFNILILDMERRLQKLLFYIAFSRYFEFCFSFRSFFHLSVIFLSYFQCLLQFLVIFLVLLNFPVIYSSILNNYIIIILWQNTEMKSTIEIKTAVLSCCENNTKNYVIYADFKSYFYLF